MQKSIVMAAAWLEIIVGVTFIAAPNLLCVLLLAIKLDGAGVPVARLAGIALLALGISCLPSIGAGARGSSVLGLLLYNVGPPCCLRGWALRPRSTAFSYGQEPSCMQVLRWPCCHNS
jgi:hypothetical protein